MSIEGVTYYRAVCDRCGDDITAHGEFSAWSEASVAVDEVVDSGGIVSDQLVVCEECRSTYQRNLDDEAWDALADGTKEALAALAAWVAETKEEAKR
jgi:hypothetical protein